MAPQQSSRQSYPPDGCHRRASLAELLGSGALQMSNLLQKTERVAVGIGPP
jgi:hypothetical protein